jgi:hypothetical protein
MDNNQQDNSAVQQPANPPVVTEQAGPDGGQKTAPTKDLGVNNPGTVSTNSPFKGSDVSMTTPQYAGGNITTTEAGSK